MFSDLCSSSKPCNPVPTIDQYLPLYNEVLSTTAAAESLCASRNADVLKDNTMLTEPNKLASLWVEAALATDLGVLQLINIDTESLLKRKVAEKPALPQVDPSRTILSRRSSSATPAKTNHSKVMPNPTTTPTWTRGYGMGETADLAKALRREMHVWFLKFVEEAMDVGFRLFGENSSSSGDMNNKNKVAAILSQLKRINDWLDGVVKTPEAELLKEKIERLKRKIYGFVITHVESAFDSSISLPKAS